MDMAEIARAKQDGAVIRVGSELEITGYGCEDHFLELDTIPHSWLIVALSNPTSQAEWTAEQAYTWTEGRVIFSSGSPFDPYEYNGKLFIPGQANNAYIFPGLDFGLVICDANRVHDEMLLGASEALANQVTQEHYDKGMVYPPLTNIRKISAHIAANVAAKAYELGGIPDGLGIRSKWILFAHVFHRDLKPKNILANVDYKFIKSSNGGVAGPNRSDSLDRNIDEENVTTNDFLILDDHGEADEESP